MTEGMRHGVKEESREEGKGVKCRLEPRNGERRRKGDNERRKEEKK